MKIYVAQYDDSGSPTGRVVSITSTLAKCVAQCSEHEGLISKDELRFEAINSFGWRADGHDGMYSIRTWEVAVTL